MNKRLLALLACLGLLLGCGGCQLADPEEDQAEQDRLIGVFATEESLDLFDLNAHPSDNAGDLAKGGGAAVAPQDSDAYEGRIWAKQEYNGDWIFQDLKGLGFYAYRSESEAGSSIASHLDDGLTADNMHVTSTDEGEGLELEATIYHVPGGTIKYHFNPVYQTPDGAVYMTSGSGINSDCSVEGEAFSQDLSSSVTATGPDGESTTMTCSVAVRVEIMCAPREIVLIQMDRDSNVLDRTSYEPGQVPESLTMAPECAYLVAETHKTGPVGDLVTRELADAGTERLSTFRARPDGVCVRHDTALNWTEGAG